MLVEDHPLFREGLRRALELEGDFTVVAEVADGQEAVQLALAQQPDVMLVDINLPRLNGLQVTRSVKEKRPDAAIIILTAYHDDAQLFHALRAGAAAYYPKDVTSDELIRAIREVHRGYYVIGDSVMKKPEMARWLLRQFEEIGPEGEWPDEMFEALSGREMEILQRIARGLSNKEVARELHISEQTVKNHMTAILRKLAVNDRTQAAIYALRHGWIRLQDT
ncbi:MAG: response regulator transcription factor [Chloroflexi bacterium]|nr:response regulator transcription factor [Chloroflexota bacterium]